MGLRFLAPGSLPVDVPIVIQRGLFVFGVPLDRLGPLGPLICQNVTLFRPPRAIIVDLSNK